MAIPSPRGRACSAILSRQFSQMWSLGRLDVEPHLSLHKSHSGGFTNRLRVVNMPKGTAILREASLGLPPSFNCTAVHVNGG